MDEGGEGWSPAVRVRRGRRVGRSVDPGPRASADGPGPKEATDHRPGRSRAGRTQSRRRAGPMRDRSLDLRRSVCALLAGAMLLAFLPAASGQSPPAASPGGDSPSQLAERLRKMEEVNQKLLRQFEALSKQNDSITKQNE